MRLRQFSVLKPEGCEDIIPITLDTHELSIYRPIGRFHPLPRQLKHPTQQEQSSGARIGIKENYK